MSFPSYDLTFNQYQEKVKPYIPSGDYSALPFDEQQRNLLTEELAEGLTCLSTLACINDINFEYIAELSLKRLKESSNKV